MTETEQQAYQALLEMTKERDDLRAKIAAVDAAIERNARIRRSEWTDDDREFVGDFTSEAAQFLAEMLLARLDMATATNYAEVRTEDLGSLHVCLTGLQIDMCFRRAGAPTPHELRLKAEKERDDAHAETAEVQDAVRNTILDIIGAEHSNRIDGAGSDAGPVEFTVMEVRQGFEVMQDRLDAALALAEERRVRVMIAGLGPMPEGWQREHNTMGHSMRWSRLGSSGAITIFCSSDLRGATPFWVNTRTKHTEYATATDAWKHAQALRSFIEEHGVLPPEHTKENP